MQLFAVMQLSGKKLVEYYCDRHILVRVMERFYKILVVLYTRMFDIQSSTDGKAADNKDENVITVGVSIL